MPPPVKGETWPAASPISSTLGAAKGVNRTAAGNEAGAAFLHVGSRKSEQLLGVGEEGLEIGLHAVIGGKAHLKEAGRGGHPGEIAARQPGIEEAMQEIGIGLGQVVVFDFKPGEEALVAAEIEELRHGRAGAIGTDQIARRQSRIAAG